MGATAESSTGPARTCSMRKVRCVFPIIQALRHGLLDAAFSVPAREKRDTDERCDAPVRNDGPRWHEKCI